MNEQAISTQLAGGTDEDTIELELSSTDLLCRLAQADPAECQGMGPEPGTEQSLAVPSDATTLASGATATRAGGAGRFTYLAGSLAITLTLIALGNSAYRVVTLAPARALAAAVSSAPQPANAESSTQAPRPSVRFTNPFDATEVFEFPPGTSLAEARASVRNILIQRARDRRIPAYNAKNTSKRRSHSNASGRGVRFAMSSGRADS